MTDKEAVIKMKEGFKVMHMPSMPNDEYLWMKKDGKIYDERGKRCNILDNPDLQQNEHFKKNWEITSGK